MEPKLKKLCNWIKKNYSELPKSNIDGKELVIFATGDFSGEYGYGSSDLESWGVDESGKLFWAYASGCSCNCSAGVDEKTYKVFETEEVAKDPTSIAKMMLLFETDNDAFAASLSSHEYTSY